MNTPGADSIVEDEERHVVQPAEGARAAGPLVRRETGLRAPLVSAAQSAVRAADACGTYLLSLFGQEWDAEGNLLIEQYWATTGLTRRRWTAWLNPAQQRRLGRALLALAAAFPASLVSYLLLPAGGLFAAPALFLLLLSAGIRSIQKLVAETGGSVEELHLGGWREGE
jgi:hypothetical protein